MNILIGQESTTTQNGKLVYTAKVHTTGGRDGGHGRSSDGRLEVGFSTPGTEGTGTNPEQLLAAGWSACFISSMRIVASKMKITFPVDVAIDAEVDLRRIDGEHYFDARLNISLPGLEREVAQSLVDAAHHRCPYSKATRGNVDVVISLV
jgi:osmotically inducible protein OsmC